MQGARAAATARETAPRRRAFLALGRAARRAAAWAAHLLFPERCAACGVVRCCPAPLGASARRRRLCSACQESARDPERRRCKTCDADLGRGAATRRSCACCRTLAPGTPRLVFVGDDDGPLGRGVRALKFAHRVGRAPALAELLAGRVADRSGPRPDLVVAVPSTRRRDRARGFNHAWELASAVGRRLGVVASASAVRRLGETPPLWRLGRAERRAAIEASFHADPARVGGRRVLLVDDVVTTGATLAACAGALRAAGARSVLGACVTRRHLRSTSRGRANEVS